MNLTSYHEKYRNYRYCSVRECKNTSIKTPGKLFIRVPSELKMRNTWLKLANRDPETMSSQHYKYFCEDHFNLENDMENYMRYKIMGSVKKIRMKPDCIPSKFECQNFRKRKLTPTSDEHAMQQHASQKTAVSEDKQICSMEMTTSSFHDFDSSPTKPSSQTEDSSQEKVSYQNVLVLNPIIKGSLSISCTQIMTVDGIKPSADSLVKQEPSASDDLVTIKQELATSDDEHVTSKQELVTSDDEHVTIKQELATSDDEHVTIKQELVTSEYEHITTKQELVTSDDEHVTIKQELVTSDDEHVTNKQELATSDDEHVTIKQELVTIEDEHVTIKQEQDSRENEHATAKMEVETSGEELILKEEVFIKEEPVN